MITVARCASPCPRTIARLRDPGLAALVAALLILLTVTTAFATALLEVEGWGANPGALRMFAIVPDGLPAGAPLIVALHGCTQEAADFDEESGWAGLAVAEGWALLLPQQTEANNEGRCFNFFSEADNRRGAGEAASIMAMVDWLQAEHGLDTARTFILGLSAGGGMAAVMLAAYPERFAGGAILAGLPYGCASTAGRWTLQWQKQWFQWTTPYGEAGWAAYACGIDRTGVLRSTPVPRGPEEWAALAREAGGPAEGPWPRVSLWQGGDDRTVHPANLEELVQQWTALHGIEPGAEAAGTAAGATQRRFRNGAGEIVVEAWSLPALGHAVPVDPDDEAQSCGLLAPHFEDHGLCAARRIAEFWGLLPRR